MHVMVYHHVWFGTVFCGVICNFTSGTLDELTAIVVKDRVNDREAREIIQLVCSKKVLQLHVIHTSSHYHISCSY